MTILHDEDLATAIRDLIDAGDELRCAVAFWGPDMAARARKRGATVVLDVSMGGTSKGALEAFGVQRNGVPDDVGDQVRVLDGLHAKIYLCRDRAIIASANASLNALGRDGRRPVLREAGTLVTKADDRESYRKVVNIWQAYLEGSRAVRPSDLDRAPSRPVIASARDWTTDDAPLSLLDAVLRRSDAFAGTAFAFGDHDIDDKDREAGNDAYKTKYGREPSSHGRQLIVMLQGQDDRATDEALRDHRVIISFWFGSRAGLHAYHDVVRIEHDGCATYFGRRSWPNVRKTLGILDMSIREAWVEDKSRAERLSKRNGDKKGRRYVAMKADALYDVLERGD